MEQKHTKLRPGMTAIAAVLALSSTQLFAQSAEAPASADAPVLVTPPAVQPAAPLAAPEQAPTVSVAAPAQAMRTASTPIVNTPDTTAASTSDAAAPTRTVSHTAVTHTQTTQAPAVATVLPAAKAMPAAPSEPVAAKTVVPAAAAAPAGASETVTTSKTIAAPVATQRTVQTVSDDGMIAGIAGLGLIALAGGAFAYSRRKKRYEGYEETDIGPDSAPVDVMPIAPVAAVPAAVVDADGPRTEVPAGFDISRFGRHTQAAYRGPTPDNPSLSLKRRLKHASFYDQRERMAAEGNAPQIERVNDAAAARRTEHVDHIVSRMRPTRSFRPVTA